MCSINQGKCARSCQFSEKAALKSKKKVSLLQELKSKEMSIYK